MLQGEGEHKFPSGHYDIAGWDAGLRHGPATYFDTAGNLVKGARESKCEIPHFPAIIAGAKEEATYVEGYENGSSVVTFPDGKREERNYEGGTLTGPAIVTGPKGRVYIATL